MKHRIISTIIRLAAIVMAAVAAVACRVEDGSGDIDSTAVGYTLFNNANDAMQEAANKLMPLMSEQANNIFLKQTQATIQLNEQKVKQERSERLPHISIVAAEHLDGPITIEVPVLDNNFNYWYIGIGVKYNISSLFKNNRKLKQVRLNVRQAQEQRQLAQEQIENAVQEGYVNFLTAFTDLRTQENSVRLADENYHVTDNRYKNEMALLTDMLDASNMKLTADLGLVDARINILYNYYKMKYITHTL